MRVLRDRDLLPASEPVAQAEARRAGLFRRDRAGLLPLVVVLVLAAIALVVLRPGQGHAAPAGPSYLPVLPVCGQVASPPSGNATVVIPELPGVNCR